MDKTNKVFLLKALKALNKIYGDDRLNIQNETLGLLEKYCQASNKNYNNIDEAIEDSKFKALI